MSIGGDELLALVHSQLDADERDAVKLAADAELCRMDLTKTHLLGTTQVGWYHWPDVKRMAEQMIANIAATRRILERHGPHPRYRGYCCKADGGVESCGCVGGGPESEWPCTTLLDIASAYADRIARRPEQAPK